MLYKNKRGIFYIPLFCIIFTYIYIYIKRYKEKNIMEMKYVDTNIGRIPLTDYLELKAMQFGFDSYAELLESGYTIDIPKVTDIEEKNII